MALKMVLCGSALRTRTGGVPAKAKAAAVPREILSRYVGTYLVGGPKAVVTLDDGGLAVKLGSQPKFRLIPRSQTQFEVESVGAKVTFNAEGDAAAKSMTIDQNGRKLEALRVEGE